MMTKKAKENELERRKLDRQLDDELHHTFPASDAPKITRTPYDRFTKSIPVKTRQRTFGNFPCRDRVWAETE
jgi:hypothetical protein